MADGHAPDYSAPARRTREPGQRRSVTVSARRTSKRALHVLRMEHNDETIAEYERPATRGDCLPGGCNGARPCPWVSCRAHLALNADEATGSIKVNFPDVPVEEMPHTCALDIADEGGRTLEEVGTLMNLTRERVRQLEARGLAGVAQSATLLDYLDAPAVKQRPAPAPAPAYKGRVRTAGHTIARLALARGESIEEVCRVSGIARKSVQHLMWRMRREASK